MGLTETIKDGDWRSVRSAIAKLGSTKLGPTAKPTFAGLTLTNAAVIGSDSVVFQPGTDSTTFFQVLDADGGTPILNVDSTNERVGIGTTSPSAKLSINGGLHVGGDSDPGDNNALVDGTFESTGVAILADASLLKTSAAPTTDAMIANKKYVDDNAGGGLSSACKIYASSNQDIVTATWTKVTFDSTDFDIDSEFDNTNDRITIKTAGYYLVTAVAGFAEAIAANQRGIIQITKNGSGIVFTQLYVTVAANPSLVCIVLEYLNVDDELELWIYQDHGANRELYGDVLYTNLAIAKIDD